MRIACLRWSILTLLVCGILSCSKGGSGGDPDPDPQEANLVVETDPANGSVVPPALGPYAVRISVTSTMPPNGVKLEVRARKDDGSGAPAFFNYSVNSSNAVNNISITKKYFRVPALCPKAFSCRPEERENIFDIASNHKC